MYCVSRKMVPNSTMNVTVIAPLAAENRGFSNTRTSSMGWLECSSQSTKHSARSAPTANAATTSGDVHPWLGASMIAHNNVARPTIDSSEPSASSFGADGSRESGMNR